MEGGTKKVVLLVRHAESTNNVAKGTLSRTLGRFRPPASLDEVGQLLSLLTFPMDSELSAAGRMMLERQREACTALAAREAIEVVLKEAGPQGLTPRQMVAAITAKKLWDFSSYKYLPEDAVRKNCYRHNLPYNF